MLDFILLLTFSAAQLLFMLIDQRNIYTPAIFTMSQILHTQDVATKLLHTNTCIGACMSVRQQAESVLRDKGVDLKCK